jgi:small subunit ribosomal protein S21
MRLQREDQRFLIHEAQPAAEAVVGVSEIWGLGRVRLELTSLPLLGRAANFNKLNESGAVEALPTEFQESATSMSVNFSVELSDGEPFERALRRFSSKLKRTGLLRDIKRKRFYTKPSVQKKLDLQKSIRRRKKAERIAHFAEQGLDSKGKKRS